MSKLDQETTDHCLSWKQTQDFVSKLNIGKQNTQYMKSGEKNIIMKLESLQNWKVGLNFNQGKSLTNIQNKDN